MLDPKNWGFEHWSAAAILGLLGTALGLQKVINLFKRGRTDDSRVDAEHELIEGLRRELDRLRADLTEESDKRRTMDKLIHEQAVRLTVMQTTMVRVVELLRQNKIGIPKDVQSDIDLLFQRVG